MKGCDVSCRDTSLLVMPTWEHLREVEEEELAMLDFRALCAKHLSVGSGSAQRGSFEDARLCRQDLITIDFWYR